LFLTAGLGCGVRVPTCPCGSREPGPYVEVPCARDEPFCSMHARARKSVSCLLRWVMVAQYRVGPAVCPWYRCVDLVWSRVFWGCRSGGGWGWVGLSRVLCSCSCSCLCRACVRPFVCVSVRPCPPVLCVRARPFVSAPSVLPRRAVCAETVCPSPARWGGPLICLSVCLIFGQFLNVTPI